TRPLIRAREIHWNEAHTAHADKEEALENLEMAWRSYLYLINDCCCFYGLRLRRPEWDKFPGSEHTDVMDTIMPCGKVLQTVGAHYLGQKFSKVFDIKFLSRENVQDYAHITCYGISTRLLAALLSLHGDDQGLVIPPILARYQVVIVPITAKDPAAVFARCREIRQLLQAANVRVLLDDGNESSGEKFYHWEMKGVPIRIEVGPRDVQNNRMVVCCRDTRTKADVDNANLIPAIQRTMEDIQARLQANARAYHESMVRDVATVDELKAALLKGGFARFPFYSMGKDGEEGDKLVHELTGGEVRGSRPNEPAPPAGTLCVITGRPATSYAYAARSY
ncbi:MAG: His/Gly/Thr/Pro-type tRNA ligase C-terminal domain-containing protein, partial [archaeon]|nr:His/Gly/Thr/Pro-type tRNA ligase C-terminal domain-containing protein [archaeon]